LFRSEKVTLCDDGFVIAFDGPARAVRAAVAIAETASRMSIRVQAGVHIGECDIVGETVSGLAVDVTRQICETADVGEILVSNTIKDLVVGSGLRFEQSSYLTLPRDLGQLLLHRVR
jgi:class 3 adenylate cyclase